MAVRIDINTNMLTWAIARAGHELHEFAAGFPKVMEWLEGTKKPTVKQLEDFSRKVHLPFGYLFLPQPPAENLPIPFFRTGKSPARQVSLNVYDTILLVQQRQEWLKTYLADNDFVPPPFVGKYTAQHDYREIVNDIRRTLDLPADWAAGCRNWEQALDYLAQRIESLGVIVIFSGVVGANPHRPIPVEECRGFVFVDELAPFMFVNAADARTAQMFTLMHELVHIWLGQSAGFDFSRVMPANDPVERLCDQVAAEFLVPADSFDAVWETYGDLDRIARYFKVSWLVAARRALDLGKISRSEFFRQYNTYMAIWQQKKDQQGSGGDFYATARKRISPSFAAHVQQAVQTNQLLYRDAYKLTGLKGETYETFFKEHLTK